jgi:hypothetical protein
LLWGYLTALPGSPAYGCWGLSAVDLAQFFIVNGCSLLQGWKKPLLSSLLARFRFLFSRPLLSLSFILEQECSLGLIHGIILCRPQPKFHSMSSIPFSRYCYESVGIIRFQL